MSLMGSSENKMPELRDPGGELTYLWNTFTKQESKAVTKDILPPQSLGLYFQEEVWAQEGCIRVKAHLRGSGMAQSEEMAIMVMDVVHSHSGTHIYWVQCCEFLCNKNKSRWQFFYCVQKSRW